MVLRWQKISISRMMPAFLRGHGGKPGYCILVTVLSGPGRRAVLRGRRNLANFRSIVAITIIFNTGDFSSGLHVTSYLRHGILQSSPQLVSISPVWVRRPCARRNTSWF